MKPTLFREFLALETVSLTLDHRRLQSIAPVDFINARPLEQEACFAGTTIWFTHAAFSLFLGIASSTKEFAEE